MISICTLTAPLGVIAVYNISPALEIAAHAGQNEWNFDGEACGSRRGSS